MRRTVSFSCASSQGDAFPEARPELTHHVVVHSYEGIRIPGLSSRELKASNPFDSGFFEE